MSLPDKEEYLDKIKKEYLISGGKYYGVMQMLEKCNPHLKKDVIINDLISYIHVIKGDIKPKIKRLTWSAFALSTE